MGRKVMLVTLQIPLTDLRPFRCNDTRMRSPHFPLPDAGKEFVRYFGQVRERNSYRKKPLAWADEQYYINATQALKFSGTGDDKLRWPCTFRRLLSDGGPVLRFEIGIRIPAGAFTGKPLLDQLDAFLDTPVCLRGEKKPIKLLLVRERLARLYMKGTSQPGSMLQDNEVIPGQPALLVQFDDNSYEGAALPRSLDFHSQGVAFMKSSHSGVPLNLWYITPEFAEPRAARTALLRLNAEHQCLKSVLRDIVDGRGELNRGSKANEKLQRYLMNVSKTLSKTSRFNVDQTELVRLTQTYDTLSGGSELDELRKWLDEIRPQVRDAVLKVVDMGNANEPKVESTGPSFQWKGSFEEVEYQSFFANGRPPLDVKWLSQVINEISPAVCLLSIPGRGRTATGFLVAKDLILTNWHVMEESTGEDIDANLSGLEMRFTWSASPERRFRPANVPGSRAAIVSSSPAEQFDYALVRASEDIAAAIGVKPFRYDGRSMPVARQGIHLIQHPCGSSLKLSVDEDGVTGIYPESGKVQYISRTQAGSSGSPCIDGSMQLIAIHHAEVQRSFGSAREGILFSAIYPRVSQFLS